MTYDSRRSAGSFDSVADSYDLYRRAYPPEVVADLIALAGVGSTTRVLEIACGTGQLSVPLAGTGAELVAVEMGPNLAAIARRNLASWARARVDVARFETWELPPEPFDAVVCATAFHWLDPEVRLEKVSQALRPGGKVAILHPHHVSGGTPGFFEDSQEFYLKWGLSDDPLFSLTSPADAPLVYSELAERPDFTDFVRHRHEIPRQYTAGEFGGLLGTDSLILALDEMDRRGFIADIRHLIETRYSGMIHRNFVFEIVSAQRAA